MRGLLVRVVDISAGAAFHGESLVRVIEQLGAEATVLATVQAKNSPFAQALLDAMRSDQAGARSFFKALARKQRAALADAFAALAESPVEAAAEEAANAPLESVLAE